jgi:hypothetical protein
MADSRSLVHGLKHRTMAWQHWHKISFLEELILTSRIGAAETLPIVSTCHVSSNFLCSITFSRVELTSLTPCHLHSYGDKELGNKILSEVGSLRRSEEIYAARHAASSPNEHSEKSLSTQVKSLSGQIYLRTYAHTPWSKTSCGGMTFADSNPMAPGAGSSLPTSNTMID